MTRDRFIPPDVFELRDSGQLMPGTVAPSTPINYEGPNAIRWVHNGASERLRVSDSPPCAGCGASGSQTLSLGVDEPPFCMDCVRRALANLGEDLKP